jgi:hypothetical protein
MTLPRLLLGLLVAGIVFLLWLWVVIDRADRG